MTKFFNQHKIIALNLERPIKGLKDKAYWQKALDDWVQAGGAEERTDREDIADQIEVSDQGLAVDGDYLRECESLISLPANLKVGGLLALLGCESLTELPAGLKVTGSLELTGCELLTSLPADLEVTGDLCLTGCELLTSLPADLKVGGDLYLFCCTSLESLPDDLKVGGYLALNGCTSLEYLPKDLQVGGKLELEQCTSLRNLPDDLTVDGDLNLKGCTSLESLPDDLKVGGHLYLQSCTSLTSLPNWITTLGRRTDGDIRHVYLERCGLSQAIIERLRAQASEGMQFHFSMQSSSNTNFFEDVTEAIEFWEGDETLASKIPKRLEDKLQEFLDRLTNTAEYKNSKTKSSLCTRVKTVLDEMNSNQEFRDEALDIIVDSLESCDDNIILEFNNIEKRLLINKALNFQGTIEQKEEELRELGKSLCKLEQVHRCAAKKCESLTLVDEVEVYLFYETRLAEDLNLPVTTRNMIFSSYAGVTDADLEKAKASVDALQETDFEEYLKVWDPWQIFQREQICAKLKYAELEIYSGKPIDSEEICVITGASLEKLEQPVVLEQFSSSENQERPISPPKQQVFEYEDIKKWWIKTGENPNPVENKKFDITNLKRVEKKPKRLARLRKLFLS
jgi:hypothetical protein